MASFASSATTCGARKHAWTNKSYLLRTNHDINEINFLISGDFNGLVISEMLYWYGGQKQITSVPTRIFELLTSGPGSLDQNG